MDFINAFLARIPPSLGSKAMFIGLSILVGVVLIRLEWRRQAASC
jgi:hypothetical protein